MRAGLPSLGYVVARSLEASLNMTGERQLPFQDHLGSLIGIDMAQCGGARQQPTTSTGYRSR